MMGLLSGLRLHTLLKRVCKSVLKKRLGDLILGDLDLDQFDLQLTRGRLQLNDLALNVEYINRKLSGSVIMLKEGSIKSLLVRFPLSVKSCEIVVEELELVLAPSVVGEVVPDPVDTDCSVSGSTSEIQTSVRTQRNESDSNQCSTSTSRDVDEGVKKIANIVKWFLTSFNIKLKNVYVVFDPQTGLDNMVFESNRSLVFRIKEAEFGTLLSTDGLLKLNNFVTFDEAVIEFLKMDDVDALLQNDPDRGTDDILAGHSTTAVLTGPIGGFSGKLNLSIPWSNGRLNLEKIDADVSVDSLELRLQISSIRWIMNVWDSLQSKPVDEQNCACSAADVSTNSFRSAVCSSASSSVKLDSDCVIATKERLAHSTFSRSKEDKIQDSFLTRAHVISDWMLPVAHEDLGYPDSDCDESIDQFFECFEELRNSQSSLGNSGIWDWTCSVFNAISCATTLASGSDQVPKEQPTEKTLRASIAEVSVLLLFSDGMDVDYSSVPVGTLDDMRNSEIFSSCLASAHFGKSTVYPTVPSLNMRHLEAKFQNISLDLQMHPKNLRFEASVAHMKLDEYYHNGNNVGIGSLFLNNNLRQDVQDALPQYLFAAGGHWVENSELCGNNSSELAKVELLQTFGECTFRYDASTTEQDGNSASSTSVYVCLAPLIFWVHFHTIYKLWNFISKIDSDLSQGERKIHMHGNEKGSSLTSSGSVFSSGRLKVQIAVSPTRIILCVPSEFSCDLSHPSIPDKFLVLDHTSCMNTGENPARPQNETLDEFHRGTQHTSIHLATGNFDIYFLKPANNVLDGRICSSSKQTFAAVKIFSVMGAKDDDCGITLIQRKYPATAISPEMVDKAWSLPKLHDQKNTKTQNSKWAGVSSSTTSQDLEELGSSLRHELLKTTELLLHIQLPCVSVQLSKNDCVLLNKLLNDVIDGISSDGETGNSENAKGKSIPVNDTSIQTSIIFECSKLEICTALDGTVEVGPLLQAELEGSWNSLKLSVSKFSLFSFSNVGGVNSASFLWVNHGEGELWGSICGKDDKICDESKEFLLVACKDSACRRGDGEGTNVLSTGLAGCSVTHIKNPKLQENYTSIDVRSGTIVAPGGRMDWIAAISLLFSSGSDGTQQSDDSKTVNNSPNSETFQSSFFLELVDVAVSYEPHLKKSALGAETVDCKFYSCLLAASSFKLHNKSVSDSSATDFDIQLRDLGLLICGSSNSKNVTCGYGVEYLCQAGYAKVAQNTFVEANLRIDSSFWKLEISDSQFDIGTCHDTTYGLVRLGSQLQQLYGPDMRDALVHLQSRWNSVQLANKQNLAADTPDKSESGFDNLMDSRECQSDGLLDDIIDNAFHTDYTSNGFWESNCHHSFSSSETDNGSELNTPEAHTTQIPLQQYFCPDHIIDSYYMPELQNPSLSSTLCGEEYQCISGCAARDDGGWYNNSSLTIVENHVLKENNEQGDKDLPREAKSIVSSLNPDESCNLKGKVLIHGIDVNWRMYAGDDWLIPQKDASCYPGTKGRDKSYFLEFSMTGLGIQLDLYPDGDVSVSKLYVSAQDLNLYDQSMHAPWKTVLGCYDSKDYPRESCSCAFRLELESVRPEPQAPLEDYRFYLQILPLQLHLDQGQLNFLISFFQNDPCNNESHLHCENDIGDVESTSDESNTIVEEALLPFFQKFDVKPLVLHINYIPRQFDPIALGKGNYAELLNILPWKGIDLKLKPVSAMGVYGWNSICETVAAEWLEDISKNQVHKLLKGLPPIRSLVAVSSGTKKLVSLPIKSYKKDRKLLKGLQRGAVAFIRSVSIEAVGLGVHLAAGAHDMLVKTERALTAVPPPLASREANRTKDNIRANQPESAQQGMKQAYDSLTDGLGRTASALIVNPIKVYNRGASAGSVLATAICGAPAAAVAPVSASARAIHSALLGIRNTLDPEHKKESRVKYHGPSQS